MKMVLFRRFRYLMLYFYYECDRVLVLKIGTLNLEVVTLAKKASNLESKR